MISTLIGRMGTEHLDAVMDIEQVAFPTHWSRAMFEREVTTSTIGHYWIVQPSVDLLSEPIDRSIPQIANPIPAVLCYGGFWLMGEEVHIVSVATHPQWRQHGFGKKLMRYMLTEAAALGAQEATLEVRVGNIAARTMYRNMGFIEVGRRKNYYPATEISGKEDALILTLYELSKQSKSL